MKEVFWVETKNNKRCCHILPTLFQVLYDGQCPLCVKEIWLLKCMQTNRPEKVDFIDISLPDYDGGKYKGVSYEMAMEEMHVIDENDKVSLCSNGFLFCCRLV